MNMLYIQLTVERIAKCVLAIITIKSDRISRCNEVTRERATRYGRGQYGRRVLRPNLFNYVRFVARTHERVNTRLF